MTLYSLPVSEPDCLSLTSPCTSSWSVGCGQPTPVSGRPVIVVQNVEWQPLQPSLSLFELSESASNRFLWCCNSSSSDGVGAPPRRRTLLQRSVSGLRQSREARQPEVVRRLPTSGAGSSCSRRDSTFGHVSLCCQGQTGHSDNLELLR